MTESEAIQARHSVRKYLDKPIEAEKIEAIQKCIDHCNREGGVHFQLVTNEPKAFRNGVDWPKYGKFEGVNNYIAIIAPKGNDGSVIAGYYGEKLVLLIQTLGMNTCWVGGTFKKVRDVYTIGTGEELKCVISLGYGTTQGVQHPQKKTFADVTQAQEPIPEWFKKGVDAALLAPTAVNQQKFRFMLHDGNRVEAQAKFSFIGYSHLDLGIAKYHFQLAAGKENFTWA
jgi:nitroreductase